MKNVTGIGRQDFKRIQSHLTAALAKAKASPPPTGYDTYVAAVDILTEATMQPQAVLVVNEQGAFPLSSRTAWAATPVKIGDVISFPLAKVQQLDVVHHLPAAPQMDIEELSLSMKHYYVNAENLFVNGRALPSQSRVSLQLSSRLFA
ncbi:uncharacterized protein LOC126767302 [Bactrocera neohumeralis]|uniref:uncharacterized protein LOC126767302 n=1 Tax=Bactrocera neohumeralis TaxID=98809 RepID=UPI002165EC87|nr:uncharacterized protein LOC126767302 [Bactrocera neohumeralis]